MVWKRKQKDQYDDEARISWNDSNVIGPKKSMKQVWIVVITCSNVNANVIGFPSVKI
jgi:hypothetical protein